jgi:hypothetical protein
MLDEHDRCAGVTGGADEGNSVVDERFGLVDRATALAIESATLDVDDEEGSGVHGLRVLGKCDSMNASS